MGARPLAVETEVFRKRTAMSFSAALGGSDAYVIMCWFLLLLGGFSPCLKCSAAAYSASASEFKRPVGSQLPPSLKGKIVQAGLRLMLM